jgi:hypothetical protein
VASLAGRPGAEAAAVLHTSAAAAPSDSTVGMIFLVMGTSGAHAGHPHRMACVRSEAKHRTGNPG